MASLTGFCGDGCSFDTGDIDCSMAFRMVESTIRIMGEIRERRVDGIAFAGVVNSGDAASVILNSQHRSSQFLSSIPPQARSTNPSFLPQTHFSYPSSAPFLAHLESVLRGLEESSLQGSPQAVSTPFAPPGKTREDISHPARYADTSPTPQPSRRLPPPELSGSEISAVSSYRDQIRHHLRARAKANTFLSPTESRYFCLSELAASCSQRRGIAGQHRQNQTSAFGSEQGQAQFSCNYPDNTSTRAQDQIFHNLDFQPASGLASRSSIRCSAEHLGELSEVVPLLSYWSPPSMASESSENQAQEATAGRRTDTPPRSIFDDYQSAYQGILSPARNFSGMSNEVDAVNTAKASSGMSAANIPFADLSLPTHIPRAPPYAILPGSVAAPHYRHKSRQPRSPKSKRRTDFSRPISVSPVSDEATRPDRLVVRDSISIFDIGSPRRLGEDRGLDTTQPNLHGASGRVEKSSTIGSIVKRYGDESDSNGKGTEAGRDVEVRSSLDIVGCGQGMLEFASGRPGSSPAGQAPTVPLPPDPSYIAAKGLIGDTLSEASLYENTEKLLNLTQTGGEGAHAEQPGSGGPYQTVGSLGERLNSEFSWMGNKGKASFRDLSARELKQLQKSNLGQPWDLPSKGVDVPPGDESYGDDYLLTDAVYHPPTAERRPAALDELVKAGARRVSEQLRTNPFEEGPTEFREPVDLNDKKCKEVARVTHDLQTGPVPDHGGPQSSSSRGVSLEVSLSDGPFRPGLYMDESSLALLIGRESADAARLSAIAKGKRVIRSVEDGAEDDLFTEGDENEGGEWETVGESGMPSKLRTKASIGRDTSGSSLANVSSIESTRDDRAATSPWDPLRSKLVMITPPTKAVIHQRSGYISGVQEPATVPRYAPPCAEAALDLKLNRTFSSTPALTFPATPQYQRRRENSPTYRHPTPLSHEHQNPFSSSPPSVDVQNPGASFELNELKDKRRAKRQAVYADSSRSLLKQIQKPSSEKTKNHLQNPFATQDAISDRSVDGSYSTVYPANLAVDGTSILNPNSPHTPKSAKSYSRGSIKRAKTYLTGSPRVIMSESRRYQRIREEMGCGTGGIVRVPGMQQVAPPQAHIPEELIGATKPYRAANPLPDLPPRNSFDLTSNEPLSRFSTDEQITSRMFMANDDMNILKKKCPTFPVNNQMLKAFFRNKDGTVSNRPKAKRGTVFERDGRIFEQAYCEVHSRWEFSHTPHLTKRIPKDDVKIQREMGRRLILLLFISVLGWPFLVFLVAWDLGHVRDDMIREYTKGAVQTFHQKEIVRARWATVPIVAVIAVALVLIGVLLK